MNILSPAALPAAPVTRATSILDVAQQLLDYLERGQRIDAAILRAAMEAAFGASDNSGTWDWKAAYEACEVATVLFLRKYGKALFRIPSPRRAPWRCSASFRSHPSRRS